MPTQIHPPSPPRLHVAIRPDGNVVVVPFEWAGDLRIYLHDNGLMSSAPEAASHGFVCVALERDAEASAVQGLLDRWEARA